MQKDFDEKWGEVHKTNEEVLGMRNEIKQLTEQQANLVALILANHKKDSDKTLDNEKEIKELEKQRDELKREIESKEKKFAMKLAAAKKKNLEQAEEIRKLKRELAKAKVRNSVAQSTLIKPVGQEGTLCTPT